MANHLSYDELSRLVERRAPPAEHARAQRHLAGCGRCRSELAWLERIRGQPQYPTALHDADRVESTADSWGNFGRPTALQRSDLDQGQPRTTYVSAFWLQSARSSGRFTLLS